MRRRRRCGVAAAAGHIGRLLAVICGGERRLLVVQLLELFGLLVLFVALCVLFGAWKRIIIRSFRRPDF